MFYNALIAPFADFEFMRRALIGSLALALVLGLAAAGVPGLVRALEILEDEVRICLGKDLQLHDCD